MEDDSMKFNHLDHMDLALKGVQEEVQEREGGFSQDGSLSRAEDTNPSVTNFVRHIQDEL